MRASLNVTHPAGASATNDAPCYAASVSHLQRPADPRLTAEQARLDRRNASDNRLQCGNDETTQYNQSIVITNTKETMKYNDIKQFKKSYKHSKSANQYQKVLFSLGILASIL